MVRQKFNQSFMAEAFAENLTRMKKTIFDEMYKGYPTEFTGTETEIAQKKASWNWTMVTAQDVDSYFGSSVFLMRLEETRIIMACTPVGDAPPIEEILPYIDDKLLDEIKSFFPDGKRSDMTPSLSANGHENSLKRYGVAAKPSSKRTRRTRS